MQAGFEPEGSSRGNREDKEPNFRKSSEERRYFTLQLHLPIKIDLELQCRKPSEIELKLESTDEVNRK